ncbi:MAG: single-stranded-DNA-specific exonuclease RecJ [Candidatus Limnocylindrales bacterium]
MSELRPRYRWLPPADTAVDPGLSEAGVRAGLSDRAVRLLAGRGQRSAADLAAHLGSPEAGLHDPALLPDAQAVMARVGRARERGERALVVGDFDADGLTGLAILVLALRRLGIDTAPYVPDRRWEGHGLSMAAVEQSVAQGRSLLLTVDTGTSSVAEVAAAAAAGVDVIITDHHHVPEQPPVALALVNPQRPDSHYPDARLAGTGVAFKVAQLLLREEHGGPDAALAFADLAVIGTVSDLAPLVGENRAIARLGLARIRSNPRPGLAALMEVAGVAPARVDLDSIAYALAPRLNAGGRVGEAMTGARLLLAATMAEAAPLAGQLEAANRTRRELTATALDEARRAAAAEPEAPAVIVAGDWPVGVIGLVAGRLAEERGVPAIVVSTEAEPWRASARAPAGTELALAFESCDDLLERHGGHPQAAGCQFERAAYPALRARLLRLFEGPAAQVDHRPTLAFDLAVGGGEVDYDLLRDLAVLEPTGPGNPPPLVGVAGLIVARARTAGAEHTSIVLRKGREVLDGIAFERADLAELLHEGDRVDLVARLASRTFGGFESLQLEVRDVAPAGHLEALGALPSVERGSVLTAGRVA